MNLSTAIILVGLVLFITPVLVPSWKGVLICSLIVGVSLTALWANHFYAIAQPDYQSGPGGALGIAVITLITIPFVLGLVARFILWLVKLKIAELNAKKIK